MLLYKQMPINAGIFFLTDHDLKWKLLRDVIIMIISLSRRTEESKTVDLKAVSLISNQRKRNLRACTSIQNFLSFGK